MAIAAFFGFGYAHAQEPPKSHHKPRTTTTIKSPKAAKSTRVADKLEAKKTNIASSGRKSSKTVSGKKSLTANNENGNTKAETSRIA